MGVAYIYRSTVVAIDELKQVIARAASVFPVFHDFTRFEQRTLALHPAALPTQPPQRAVTLHDTAITGYLPTTRDPFPAFADVLCKSAPAIQHLGLAGIEVGYEEKGCLDPQSKPDYLGVALRGGKGYVTYRVEGSQASYDLRYRQTFLRQLIKTARLPLKLAARKDLFNLYHTASGELVLAQALGYNGENPGAFRCEIPRATADELLARVQQALQRLASPRPFTYTWYAATVPGPFITDLRPAAEMYEAVVAAHLPAEQYDLTFTATPHGLDGLETLRRYCGPHDDFVSYLGQGQSADGVATDLEVAASSIGYRLHLTPRGQVDLANISAVLGVDFS